MFEPDVPGEEPIRIQGQWLKKFIPVVTLRALLDELRDDDDLVPNHVGNLSIIRLDDRGGWYVAGYIDIGGETVEMRSQP